jgi:hypothetical protein
VAIKAAHGAGDESGLWSTCPQLRTAPPTLASQTATTCMRTLGQQPSALFIHLVLKTTWYFFHRFLSFLVFSAAAHCATDAGHPIVTARMQTLSHQPSTLH